MRAPKRSRRLAAACVFVTVACGITPQAAGAAAPAGHVEEWIDLTLREIAAHRTNPPRAARALALVSVAMDRAIRRRPAAVPGAASEVVAYLFPDRAQAVRSRAADASPSQSSLALGRDIGEQVAERGRRDGSDAVWDGVRPQGDAYWQPTPPGFGPPLEPLAGRWRPWHLTSGDALRPPPPPSPGTDGVFERQATRVYEVSRALTEEQRATAVFWADGAGTETPPGHWNRIALGLAGAAEVPAKRLACLLAVLNTAQADAFIAAWDAKFAYWSARPVTFVRAHLDPEWLPLLQTPPFPGYVSGHATTSGAASSVIAAALPEHADAVRAMAAEAADSRLYGGIHAEADNVAGLALGRSVGDAALGAGCAG